MRKFSTFNFQLSTRKGFTLIEILVAIAIIGVLAVASITMINPLEQIKKSRDAQRKQDLRQLQIALEAYNADTNRYPAANGEQQITGAPWGGQWLPYIAKVPKDPLSTQSYRYESTDMRSYRLNAQLENCKDPQIIGDCAYFNYQVTSSNVAIAALPTPIPTNTPTPTPTPTPTFKTVFVTSTSSDSNLLNYVKTNIDINFAGSGLDAGDRICKWRADNAQPNPLGGVWTAWLSDFSKNAIGRITWNGEYRLVNGTIIANNKADLIDGSINNPIKKNENNVDVISEFVWTGTHWNGSRSVPCANWTSISIVGDSGVTVYSDNRWTYFSQINCTSSARIYCFEQ